MVREWQVGLLVADTNAAGAKVMSFYILKNNLLIMPWDGYSLQKFGRKTPAGPGYWPRPGMQSHLSAKTAILLPPILRFSVISPPPFGQTKFLSTNTQLETT
jgi:hypothetical protein